MKVILLEKQRNLGGLGDQVKVRSGHARNWLIPQGKAIRATQENIIEFEKRRAELERLHGDQLTQAKHRADALSALVLSCTVRAAEDGKLFGSIGVRDIVQAIQQQNLVVEKSEVLLPHGAFKQIGEYTVQIQVHPDVVATVKLQIMPETLDHEESRE